MKKRRRQIVGKTGEWIQENLPNIEMWSWIDYPEEQILAAEKHKQKTSARKYREQKRKLVYDHYGNQCACCKERTREFLTLDHLKNDGNVVRKAKHYSNTYEWMAQIIAAGFPVDVQLLCRNCNWGKHVNGGICPHKSLAIL